MGRSEKAIDWDEVDSMCEAGCPAYEIASHFAIHPNTLTDKVRAKYNQDFSTYAQELKHKGNRNIRFKQYEKAIEGSIPMLTLLGKTRLGQTDKVIVQTSNEATQEWIDNQSSKSKDLVDETTRE